MLDQSINYDSIKFVISDYDRKYLYPNEFKQLGEESIINSVISSFYKNQAVPNLREFKLKTKSVYQISDINSYFLMKRFLATFKTVNALKQSNRASIVNSIVSLLEDQRPYTIIRLDIKDFYESIDRNKILSNLKNDNAYSESTIRILEKFYDRFELSNIIGLPRGLSLSAYLSEYYLRDFDKQVKRLDGVFFYARFVDDIIIFSFKEIPQNELNNIFKLPQGLNFHDNSSKKYKVLILPDKRIRQANIGKALTDSFSYLGYIFTYNNVPKTNICFSIDIAPEKVKKIKTRIVKAFKEYIINSDILLLEKRIKFLTHNFIVHKKYRDTKVKTGIYYNYLQLTKDKIENGSLNELDEFLKIILFNQTYSKKILGASHNLHLSQNKKNARKLAGMSFRKGYENQKFAKFSVKEIKQINQCWNEI